MKRNKYKDYLWYVALAVFVLCILEGIMYYHDTENTFLKISLNIQNAIKAYKIDPDIKQAEAIRFLNESGGGFLRSVLTYLYCASVIVAPFCTIGALTILISKPADYIHGIINHRSLPHILILGQGKQQESFVDALAKDCQLTVVETSKVTEEKKKKYLRDGAKLIVKYDDMPWAVVLKSLKLSKFKAFLLCDESSLENVELLKLLLPNENCSKADNKEDAGRTGKISTQQKIYVCCNDSSMAEIIRQYYDSVKSEKPDMSIVDVNQMAVSKMFLEHPLYMHPDYAGGEESHGADPAENKGKWDVHMGIIGFGEFGRQTLLQCLNMGVLSADSHICIDVFDKHMPDIIGSFMNRFSVDILNYLKLGAEEVFQKEKVPYYELELPGTGKNERFGMDGSVTLRFWKADAQTLSFHKIFKQQHERMPFTYLVVALGDTACMAETLLALKRLLRQKNAPKDAPAITVPIIVRTKSETDIVKVYTEHEDDLLFEIVQNKDIYSYKALANEEIVERAKIFNYRYGQLYDVISPIIKPYKGGKKPFDDQLKALLEQAWAEERQRENENKLQSDKAEVEAQWKRMDIFSRESSIAQALHQDVKRWLIEDKHYSPEKDKAELQKIEHRRWVLFMITQGFRYDKNRDNDVKDHDCILSWEDLEKNRPDTMEYDFTPYFILQNSTDSK